jgi:DNA-binding phage protein
VWYIRHMARKPNAYERFLAEQLADPEFRAEFERERHEIETIDAIVNALDGLRDERGLTKADLARQIGKNPASVRRLLTASGNPELRTVVAMANALDADIKIVRRSPGRARRTAA